MDGRKICLIRLVKMGVVVGAFIGVLGCANTQNEKKDEPEVLLGAGNAITPMDPEYQKAANVNVELGLGYLAQGQTARAKNKLTRAIKLAPNSSEPHSAMAHFLERTGEKKEAEKEHKKAIKFANGKGAVHNNYGGFLCREGRMKEAQQSFQHALQDKDYSRTAEVYENAGICAIKASDLEAANQYLKSALQQDPKRTIALLELCNIKLQQGELNEAKGYLVQYKKIAEPSARSLWLGLQLSHQMNDQDAVASQSLILKNLFENSPEYQMYLKSDIPKQS